jgi:HSP20 family molecular chaperone IbpA
MNINATLVPKSTLNSTGYNTWDIVDLVDRTWPSLTSAFDLVTSPKYSFSNMIGFKEQNKDSYSLEIELPRFRKENIKLNAENNILHISAEQDNLKFYHSISIPQTLDSNSIEAKLDHGVLTITANKAEQARLKTISIK